ncbi:transcription antiterminator [Alkalihalobacillus hwajinpoensis]|uniref:BglG family transcription antiterminator n=1 Tax=Guptibacillus hwajinpoensis TaxID=208199 RepID=UPI00188345BE|nr:BglG family transcription antiterminator [Pseudalkalibacillus hwajinpoensis]MBF0709342.1 transcription antiterminator [Pseudalkalibacillus hwajinpoensis]
MNERQKKLMCILLETSGEFSLVKDLSVRLSCSDKTIRNDLDVIQPYIRKETGGSLIRKTGLGIQLVIENEERDWLYQKFSYESSHADELSQSERLLELAYKLLTVKGPMTLQNLSTSHFITRSVLKKDLEQINQWLKTMNLTLHSRQKVGVMIEGKERLRRSALVNLGKLVQNEALIRPFLKKQFTLYEIELVEKELRNLQNEHSITYTDESFENLLYHTLFIIKRTKLRQSIQVTDKEEKQIKEYEEYEWSKALLKKLGIVFVAHFPVGEVAYLALHLIGAKRTGVSIIREPEVERIGLALINEMTEMTNLSFNADANLMEGLRVHLYAALNRIQYGLSVSNPMLQEIKRMYPYLFDLLIQITVEMQDKWKLSIPEDEIAYLTLHFEAAVERLQSNRGEKKSVVIVCHLGVGMSQLLQTKLERKFSSLIILNCIGRTALHDFLTQHQVDFIISTVEMEPQSIPHIVISPLLNTEEESKLESFLGEMDQANREERRNAVFSNYLQSDLVFVQHDGNHRYKVIEVLSNALYEKGFVEKEYVHQALIRERTSSTAIGSGIAIPHGNPNFIHTPGIAVAVLKEPIEWGEERVNLVFLLALGNQGGGVTRELFREISSISEQPLFLKKLTEQTSANAFINCLETNAIEK